MQSRLIITTRLSKGWRPSNSRSIQIDLTQKRRAPAMAKDLWALDFDGVVCDSVGESSESAWKASARKWPELFAQPEVQAQREAVLALMRETRPVIETGYENLVMVRCFLEGTTAAEVLAGWHTLLPRKMEEWQLDRGELVSLFGSTRDEWIEQDLEGWLAANAIYPGLADALRHALERHEVYIVTTKQARFTEALLHGAAGVQIPADRIFSTTTSGQPKSEVLAMLRARHPGASAYSFVEDKLGTLFKVEKLADFDPWQLYLADWGYNTAEEKQQAQQSARIELISRSRLKELLT